MMIDCHQAATLDPQQQHLLIERLIRDAYTQQQILNCAFRRVAQLEIEIMLACEDDDSPQIKPPTAEHYQMAAELMAKAQAAQNP